MYLRMTQIYAVRYRLNGIQIRPAPLLRRGGALNALVFHLPQSIPLLLNSAHLHYQVTLAGAPFVQELTGFCVGTVPPLGHRVRLPTLVDAELLKYSTVVGGSGRRQALFRWTERTRFVNLIDRLWHTVPALVNFSITSVAWVGFRRRVVVVFCRGFASLAVKGGLFNSVCVFQVMKSVKHPRRIQAHKPKKLPAGLTAFVSSTPLPLSCFAFSSVPPVDAAAEVSTRGSPSTTSSKPPAPRSSLWRGQDSRTARS